MFALMGIKALYREYLQQLREIYPASEAASILDQLFESVADIQRAELIKHPARELTAALAQQLQDRFNQLLQHYPLQYVTGEAWFCDMKLFVSRHVLIPRPETEELVQIVINDSVSHGAKHAGKIKVLDVGTGSGCIAIALKKKIPFAEIHAVDVSENALKVARRNASDQQVDITFLLLDFLSGEARATLPVYDIIVSNPPYIPLHEKEKLDKNVRDFEPGEALFVPDHSPLVFYQKIAVFGLNHLVEGGKIFVEVHEDYATETAACFNRHYNSVEIIEDIFGKQRMIIVSGKTG